MNKMEHLELDIDLRMLNVWSEAKGLPESMEFFASLLRAAYGKGYHDALGEPVRGQLCKDHSYPIPERKCS